MKEGLDLDELSECLTTAEASLRPQRYGKGMTGWGRVGVGHREGLHGWGFMR